MLPCVCSIIDQRRRQKRDESISDTIACGSCATFLSLPRFDFICDLLLNRRTAKWSLFVVTQQNKQKNKKTTEQKKSCLTRTLIVWVSRSPCQLTDLSKYSSKGIWKGSQPAFLAFLRIFQKKSLAIGIDLWSGAVFSHCWLLVAAVTYYEAICLYLRFVLI